MCVHVCACAFGYFLFSLSLTNAHTLSLNPLNLSLSLSVRCVQIGTADVQYASTLGTVTVDITTASAQLSSAARFVAPRFDNSSNANTPNKQACLIC